jgi:hypothetical protein
MKRPKLIIAVDGQRFEVSVRRRQYRGTDGRTLTELTLQPPSTTPSALRGLKLTDEDRLRLLVNRIMIAGFRLTKRDGQLGPDNPTEAIRDGAKEGLTHQADATDETDIRRDIALGFIGVAYRYEDSAIAVKTVDPFARKRALDNEAKDSEADMSKQPVVNVPKVVRWAGTEGQHAEDPELNRTVKATLLPNRDFGQKSDKRYVPESYWGFEKGILKKWREICDRQPEPIHQFQEMRKHLEDLRKNADDDTRQHLRILRTRCDESFARANGYVMQLVTQERELGQQLDPASLVYNRFIYCEQDKLGGLVPTLHPVWNMCMRSPQFVDLIHDYCQNPRRVELITHLNAILAGALAAYAKLCDDSAERAAEKKSAKPPPTRLRAADGDDEDFDVLENVPDAALTPDQVVGHKIILDMLLGGLDEDRDVQILRAIVEHGFNQEEAAREFNCSQGEISKAKARAAAKLRQKAESMAITADDIG